MSNKIGFWSVFALVTGSQLGTGALFFPSSLAPYGLYSMVGWLISSCGAIALSLVFASLCSRFPQTGGPHVYVLKAFGPSLAFFTGWTYWVISWVSTAAVVVSSIGYLSPFIGNHSKIVYLALEILLLLAIAALNLKGVKAAGKVEFFLAALKFAFLMFIPVIALFYFDSNNFAVDYKVSKLTFSKILGQVTLLTLWGFIGLESATTPAGCVDNPSKTIPRAIVIGTICVALIYIVSSIGIMGLMSGKDLMRSNAPYIDAAQLIFGGSWYLVISVVSSIICIGTLNAWILTSGQIALGLAEDKLMPKFFAEKNQNSAPMYSLIISCSLIIPLLILTSNDSLSQQITYIIEISVISFLFIYLICSISLLKLLVKSGERPSYCQFVFSFMAIIFCGFVIYETPLATLCIAGLFTLSGLPVYFFWYAKSA
jgi:APA family basic amino acid/polyamine antiporter